MHVITVRYSRLAVHAEEDQIAGSFKSTRVSEIPTIGR